MSRWILGGLVMAAVACGDSSETTGATESAQTSPTDETETAASEAANEAAAAAEAAAEAEEASNTRDVAGLSVVLNDDGTIDVSGSDRWGGSLDTTYASLEYFTNAVPVISRSVTEEQAAGLSTLAEELAAADSESGGGEAGATEEAAGGEETQ